MLSVAANSPDGSEVPANTIPPRTAPVWTVAPTTKVSLTPSADGNTCEVTAVAVGAANVVTCTEGAVSTTFTIDVVDGTPTTMTITAGTPDMKNDLQVTKGRGLGLGYAQ
jgi:hypothetical protein